MSINEIINELKKRPISGTLEEQFAKTIVKLVAVLNKKGFISEKEVDYILSGRFYESEAGECEETQ